MGMGGYFNSKMSFPYNSATNQWDHNRHFAMLFSNNSKCV